MVKSSIALLIEENSCLYNIRLSNYYDHNKRKQVLESIAEKLQEVADEEERKAINNDNIKPEEIEIAIDCLNQAFLVEVRLSVLEMIQTSTPPTQYQPSKPKWAVENDPLDSLEIPPADALRSSEVATSEPSEAKDHFIPYVMAQIKRISHGDVVQELAGEIRLKSCMLKRKIGRG